MGLRTPLKLNQAARIQESPLRRIEVSSSTFCKDPVRQNQRWDVGCQFRHLGDENLVVLDASKPPVVPGLSLSENKFTAIAGAQWFDYDQQVCKPACINMTLSTRCFRKKCRRWVSTMKTPWLSMTMWVLCQSARLVDVQSDGA